MQNVRRLFDPNPVQPISGFTSRDLVPLVLKHKVVIILCLLASTAGVIAALHSLPPLYKSHAKILIKIEEQGSPSFFSGIASYRDSNSPEPANRKMENEMELIETWPISAEVVKRLGLTYDQVYHPPYAYLLRPLVDFYDHIASSWLGRPLDPEKYGFADTVAAFQKSLEVKAIESKTADTNSNILEVSLRGVDKSLTQKALDALVDFFIGYDNQLNKDGAMRAEAVVAQTVTAARHDVEVAQRKLQEVLAKSGLTSRTEGSTPTGDPDVIRSTPGEGSIIGLLKSNLLDLQMKLVKLQSNVVARTPEMLSLENQIKVLTGRLDREQQRHAQDDSSLLEIRRELQLKESILVDLEKRLSQVRLFLSMGASQISNRVVVEPPLLPRSSEWKLRTLVGVASAIGGLFLGFAFAGLREFTDHRLQRETDVQRHLGVPVAGSISYVKSAALGEALDAQTVHKRLNGSPDKTLEKRPPTKLLTSPHDTMPS
ncbi:MAG: GumC family protein [Gammaproteobacteria bacterium]